MNTFEEKMARLEEINSILKEEKNTFSEMTELFEEGIKLSASLEQELDQAEQKIIQLREDHQEK